MSDPVVIVSVARTPMGAMLGSLTSQAAHQLGAVAIKAAVERAGLSPEQIDEVIMGNVLQAGQGQAPARQATLGAGLPKSVAATTIHKVCGSGMKAAMFAHDIIKAGSVDVVVAGGQESMSNAPTYCYVAVKATAMVTLPSTTTWHWMGLKMLTKAVLPWACSPKAAWTNTASPAKSKMLLPSSHYAAHVPPVRTVVSNLKLPPLPSVVAKATPLWTLTNHLNALCLKKFQGCVLPSRKMARLLPLTHRPFPTALQRWFLCVNPKQRARLSALSKNCGAHQSLARARMVYHGPSRRCAKTSSKNRLEHRRRRPLRNQRSLCRRHHGRHERAQHPHDKVNVYGAPPHWATPLGHRVHALSLR